MTKSLDDILQLDDAGFANAIIEFVNDEQIAHGFDSLTDIEQTVLLANDCEFRIVRSGIIDPASYPEKEWREGMIASLAEIGAAETAALLREATRLFDAIPAHEKERAETIDDLYALAGAEKLDGLSAAAETSACDAEIANCLHRYIVRNRARFRAE
jgi:hypothetical protein